MRHFCQVIQVGDSHAVVAPSRFSGQRGKCLATFVGWREADDYARDVNRLARVFRSGRAKDAKEPRV